MDAVVPAPQKKRRPFRFLFRLVAVIVVISLIGLWWAVARIPDIDPSPTLSAGLADQTFLLIGSDSRADLPDDLEGAFGSFGGERADVVILARPSGGTLQLISLPRDLKVEVPGHGTNKLNAAFAFGGAPLLVETVTAATGVPIQHAVEIDFAGFADLVDSVGGLDMAFPFGARDTKSGLTVEAGTTQIDGATALAFARSRSYQEFRDGAWVSIDADDLGRTGRQQQALEALLRRVASVGGALRLPAFLMALEDAVRVDDGLNALNVLIAAGAMWKADIDAATIPVRFSNEGGVSYVVFETDAATTMLTNFLNGNPLE